MDAFAVSMCMGLRLHELHFSHCLTAGLWFGGFQALMPMLGWFLGAEFAEMIRMYDHWIALILLCLIGGGMIRSSREEEEQSGDFSPRAMLPLAVATSIDALAVGVTLAFLQVHIVQAVAFIGCTTFVLSAIGVLIGHFAGSALRSKAELFGGLVLIAIGIKIWIEHMIDHGFR